MVGIEVGAVLDLHPGLKLRQVEEVAAVDRQILDLTGGQHALHRGLLGIDADRRGFHADRGGFRADLQLEVDRAVVADLGHDLRLGGFESFGFDLHQIGARSDGAGVVKAAAVGGDEVDTPVSIRVIVTLAPATAASVASVTSSVDVSGGDRGLTSGEWR